MRESRRTTGQELSRAEALNLAAWLVAVAHATDAEFAGVLEAVRDG